RRRHTRFSRDWSSDVCSSDLADKRMAHNIDVPEPYDGNTLNTVQYVQGLHKSRFDAAWQIDLAWITRNDHSGIFAKPRQEHLHLHRCRILRFVKDYRSI